MYVMKQPRKNTKIFAAMRELVLKGNRFVFSDIQRIACRMNGRDFDLTEPYQDGEWVRGFGWVPNGKVKTRRVNRGYWCVNIKHAFRMGYLTRNSDGTISVSQGIDLS